MTDDLEIRASPQTARLWKKSQVRGAAVRRRRQRRRRAPVRMRADTCILLLYLPLAIFGSKAEKNESAFVATHEWQTVKKGEYLRRAVCPTVGLLYTPTEIRRFVRHHVSQIRRTRESSAGKLRKRGGLPAEDGTLSRCNAGFLKSYSPRSFKIRSSVRKNSVIRLQWRTFGLDYVVEKRVVSRNWYRSLQLFFFSNLFFNFFF